MILILTASIMYWSLQQHTVESESSAAEDSDIPGASPAASTDGENEAVLADEVSNQAMDTAVSDSALTTPVDNEEPSSNVEEKDHDGEWPENEAFLFVLHFFFYFIHALAKGMKGEFDCS